MDITDDQKRRAEANRLAALEKRKRAADRLAEDPWRLFRCRKIPSPTTSSSSSCGDPIRKPDPNPPLDRFRVVIEVCSPTEFSVTPEPLKGFTFPGGAECSRKIDVCLSPAVPVRLTGSQGGQKVSVYKLNDHELVLRCLKKLAGVELQDIPHITLSVVKKFQDCAYDKWNPLWNDDYFSDEQVDKLLPKVPKSLRDALLPFQLEGVRFGLRRGGRCLIADEMGLGKTIQAIAIACCFQDEGPILVVCPAVLRFSWAEEFEHWLPFLLPNDIHLVFGHKDSLDHVEKHPKVTIISYTMLNRLRRSMLQRKWALLIVDESHNLRCTKKKLESAETEAVLEAAANINRIILLSGTPSLSRSQHRVMHHISFHKLLEECDHRPYDIYHQINILWPRLLGKDKYEFAKNYCLITVAQGFQDFSKGIRLGELNVLLSQTLMIRRLKENVLTQLPPKRRQVIRLKLKKADMPLLTTCSFKNGASLCGEHLEECMTDCCSNQSDVGVENTEDTIVSHDEECHERALKQLTQQEIGIAKLPGFREWFYNHSICRELEDAASMDLNLSSQKMVIFGHHLRVLDRVQEFICEKGIQFVRIDGRTLARDRQAAVETFRLSIEVKIALIGITAGGVGLDFSTAQNVVFLELPKTASEMLQAEDRAHRRGQINAVNIYIFCAKDTLDESHWLQLNKSLFRVSTMTNGKDDAIHEIEVDRVFHPGCSIDSPRFVESDDILIDSLNGENPVSWESQANKSHTATSEESGEAAIEHIKVDKNGSSQRDPLHLKVETFQDTCHDLDTANNSTFHENVTAENMHKAIQNNLEGGSSQVIEADMNTAIQVESVRFEVSRYTGRIHLYVCIPGKDSRPRPLFVNFRPEDLEFTEDTTVVVNKKTALQLLKENPEHCKIFRSFINEWSGLRPIDRNKLLGKPIQLPLSLELCYLKESVNHGPGGLLKGGSKRRVTPLSSISCPLTENAVWKKVALHDAAKGIEYTQAWTISDEPLCKLCQEPCKGKLGKAPEYFEDLFCNLSCFQEYRIRTSRGALRRELFQIEHGVCSHCKLDCHKLVECVRPLSIARRKEYIHKLAPKVAQQKKLFDKLVYEPIEGNAWHADHIIPVYKGGGECRLENMRTLCVACHAEVTMAQQSERKLARKRAKEQLKNTMKDLEDSDPSKPISGADANGDELDGEAAEDVLFIQVPGSDYSREDIFLQ